MTEATVRRRLGRLVKGFEINVASPVTIVSDDQADVIRLLSVVVAIPNVTHPVDGVTSVAQVCAWWQ